MEERYVRRSFFLIGFTLTSLFVFSATSPAGTLMQNSSGAFIRHFGTPTLLMVGNPVNRSGLSPADVFGLITNSLNRWKQATGNQIQFDYWQDTQYPRNLDYNQQSSIFFTSQTDGAIRLGSSVLAVTQVWHYVESGQIIETDIALNDNDFVFTGNPGDSTLTTGRSVYLGNVLTHEFGHALGLSHSANIQSTMLFLEAPQQAWLSCDDIQTIHAAYRLRSDSLGQITGRILDPNGNPLVGVHVSAISINRGTVLGSALSNRSGNFNIAGLEPGSYRIVAEPYYAGSSPLPDYYNTVAGTICSGGRFFSRTFKNQAIAVTAGGVFNSGDFPVQCASSGDGAIVQPIPGGSSLANPIPLSDFLLDSVPLSGTTRKYYDLGMIQGEQRFNVIQFGLYSPVQTALRLVDSAGRPVNPELVNIAQPSFIGGSGFRNADATLETRTDLPMDRYYLEVTSRLNTADIYPAEFLALDSTGFYVITRSAVPSSLWSSAIYAKNSRCESADQFDTYRSPPGAPRSGDRQRLTSEPSSKFCATVREDSNRDPPTTGTLISWFLPFIFIALTHFLRKLRIQLNY